MRTERALNERARDLHAITDAVPGVVFQFEVASDGAYRFNFISRGVGQLLELGTTLATPDFAGIMAFVLPDDRPALAHSIADVVRRVAP